SAEQVVHRLPGSLAHQVPKRDIHGADGLQRGAFAPEVDRTAVHLLPQKLHIEGAGAQDDRLQAVFENVERRTVANPHTAYTLKVVISSQADHDAAHRPAPQAHKAFT